MPTRCPDPALARLLRRSRVLDTAARRHWLAVLPHLTPEDRERLRAILLEAEAGADAEVAARRPASDRPGRPRRPDEGRRSNRSRTGRAGAVDATPGRGGAGRAGEE